MDKVKFCKTCKHKTCLKTKKICIRLDNWLKKHVEKQFWHGVESFMQSDTLDYVRQSMYGIENNNDTQ